MNAIRRANPALQQLDDLRFLDTYNDSLIAYVKQVPGNTVFCVVNLDPHAPQEGVVDVPADINLPLAFPVDDQLSGERYQWHVGQNYVRLDPVVRQSHVLVAVGP
jgi:starch synthase (maltosyl-transferring)